MQNRQYRRLKVTAADVQARNGRAYRPTDATTIRSSVQATAETISFYGKDFGKTIKKNVYLTVFITLETCLRAFFNAK